MGQCFQLFLTLNMCQDVFFKDVFRVEAFVTFLASEFVFTGVN